MHRSLMGRRRGVVAVMLSVMLPSVMFVQACSSDAALTVAPNDDPETVFQDVRVTDHFIMLGPTAPYDTITIGATAYNAAGAAIAGAPAPRFESTDTNAVTVSEEGTIRVKQPGKSAVVRATITIGMVTIRDSAIVQVALAQPSLTQFSAAPPPPDSAKYQLGTSKNIKGTVAGTNLVNMRVYYEVGDMEHASFGSNITPTANAFGSSNTLTARLNTYSPGHLMIYASATVGGVRYRDSVDFTVGYPASGSFSVQGGTKRDGTVVYAFNAADLIVGVGSTVNWTAAWQAGNIPYSVVFDDPSFAKSVPGSTYADNVDGNIQSWDYVSTLALFRSRRFTRPGRVKFTAPELGASAYLTVVDDRACMPDCPPLP